MRNRLVLLEVAFSLIAMILITYFGIELSASSWTSEHNVLLVAVIVLAFFAAIGLSKIPKSIESAQQSR